jgi:two-component sensor histidine kinase
MRVVLLFLVIWLSNAAFAQTNEVLKLESEVKRLNDAKEYDTSLQLLLKHIDDKNTSQEDRVYAYILISQTHKRIFDYPKVLAALSEAKAELKEFKTKNVKLLSRIKLEFALAYFDVRDYKQAGTIIDQLHGEGFNQLSGSEKALIYMQEAYIAYLNNDFSKAESLYKTSESKMLEFSPRDLPIVYGKKISLYAKLKNREKMEENYRLACYYADLYKIAKYNLYACEIMRESYQELGDYKAAFHYFTKFDSIQTLYNADDYKKNLKELEVKYETEKKEKELKIKEGDISAQNRLIAALVTLLVMLIFGVLLIQNIQRRKVLLKEKLATRRFAKALIENVEEERKRISGDLHDSVNNELLLFRSSAQSGQKVSPEKIDSLIDYIRRISRNLHPVMFEELGLQNSVEQMVFQVQEYNQFILNAEINYKNGLDSKDALQVFRIIQEATNNIIKYSKAMAALIKIDELADVVLVEIKDNGVGFNLNEQWKSVNSMGLLSMKERTEMLGGTIKIKSSNEGTYINLSIPKKRKQ